MVEKSIFLLITQPDLPVPGQILHDNTKLMEDYFLQNVVSYRSPVDTAPRFKNYFGPIFKVVPQINDDMYSTES